MQTLILLAFMAPAHAEDFAMKHEESLDNKLVSQFHADKFWVGKLFNELVDTLFSRARNPFALHHINLDDTTLRKGKDVKLANTTLEKEQERNVAQEDAKAKQEQEWEQEELQRKQQEQQQEQEEQQGKESKQEQAQEQELEQEQGTQKLQREQDEEGEDEEEKEEDEPPDPSQEEIDQYKKLHEQLLEEIDERLKEIDQREREIEQRLKEVEYYKQAIPKAQALSREREAQNHEHEGKQQEQEQDESHRRRRADVLRYEKTQAQLIKEIGRRLKEIDQREKEIDQRLAEIEYYKKAARGAEASSGRKSAPNPREGIPLRDFAAREKMWGREGIRRQPQQVPAEYAQYVNAENAQRAPAELLIQTTFPILSIRVSVLIGIFAGSCITFVVICFRRNISPSSG